MKSRIAIWAAIGALVAAFWAVYITTTMQNLRYPDSIGSILIRITCPISLASHHAVSLYQVIFANALTYALVGAVVEIARRNFRVSTISS
jgi:hypothetical protein